MNSEKSTKEVILQQLKCLSNRYGELLKYFDETEHTIEKPTTDKRSWKAFFKKDVKRPQNSAFK
jgi:hypothetical protein